VNRHFPKRPSKEKSIEATAAAWLAQQDDHLSPEQAAAFARWREENPLHDAAVRRLEKTWSTLHLLRDFRPESATHPNRDLLATRKPTRVLPFLVLATITAMAASLVLVALWRPSRTSNPVRPAVTSVQQESDALVYTTAIDGYQRISLADGSVVELNANSEIRVSYTAAERRVRLLRGEANFVVAKNPQRPFWVEAGKISVRAVGTVFNVRLGSKDIEVLVTEGKVAVKANPEGEVAPTDRGDALPSITSPPADDAFIIAGQRLVFSIQSPSPKIHIESLPPDVIRDSLAWQGSTLRFMDTPLAEVAAQFNRWNQVQIEIADASLTHLPVDGNFRANNVEAFVRLLESNGNITVERVGTERVILHEGR
jgi:transmembrane sensor